MTVLQTEMNVHVRRIHWNNGQYADNLHTEMKTVWLKSKWPPKLWDNKRLLAVATKPPELMPVLSGYLESIEVGPMGSYVNK